MKSSLTASRAIDVGIVVVVEGKVYVKGGAV